LINVDATGGDELTDEDRRLIRESLRELASVAERTVRSVTTQEVVAGSPAHLQALAIAELLGDTTLFTQAHNSVHLTILAATGHLKTFVAVAGREGTTTPTATLTRGSVEALGKSYYLLTAPDASTLLRRHVGMQEYEFDAMKSNDFQDADGNLVDLGERVREMRAVLLEHRITPLKPKSDVHLSGMVRDLLESSAELDAGLSRKLYAQLSSIAHANTSSIAMHMVDDGSGPRLRLPRAVVLEQAGMNVGTLIEVIDRYLAFNQPAGSAQEQWEQALGRAARSVRKLQETLGDSV
jgi:hypothetical protein